MIRLRDWIGDEQGAVAALYAIGLPVLVAMAGIGFDYARIASLDTELQNAADQAALAGATQLTQGSDSIARATSAAQGGLAANSTLFANDGAGTGVSIPTANVFFYQTRSDAEAGTNPIDKTATNADKLARFIRVKVATRTANYALTPVVGAISGTIDAEAVAGIGASICGTAALSYCNTNLPANFNPDAYKGHGLLIGTMSGSGTWGYLKVPPSNNADGVELVLAQDRPAVECRSLETDPIALPGSASGLVRAINTRFDIFDNNIDNTNQPCDTLGDCGPAKDVIKDVVKNNKDKWVLPSASGVYSPGARTAAYNPATSYDADGIVESMGMPRDLCHYGSYSYACSSGTGLTGMDDLGDGKWDRAGYFSKYHAGRAPTNSQTITRYETYLWELKNSSYLDTINGIAGASGTQYSKPVTVGASTSALDRRVLSVAFTKGTGGSCPGANDPVTQIDWVDVFFVQPGVSKRGNYPAAVQENSSDPLYMEIIGRTKTGAGSSANLINRQVPYLIK